MYVIRISKQSEHSISGSCSTNLFYAPVKKHYTGIIENNDNKLDGTEIWVPQRNPYIINDATNIPNVLITEIGDFLLCKNRYFEFDFKPGYKKIELIERAKIESVSYTFSSLTAKSKYVIQNSMLSDYYWDIDKGWNTLNKTIYNKVTDCPNTLTAISCKYKKLLKLYSANGDWGYYIYTVESEMENPSLTVGSEVHNSGLYANIIEITT